MDFVIHAGEVVALIGPNGVGKTSLLKTLAGLLPCSGGSINLDSEMTLHSTPFSAWNQKVFYVGPYLYSEFSMTVSDVLSLVEGASEKLISETLETLHGLSLRNRRIRTLSGGEVQKILLARAWLTRARYLLLDETLSLMDLNHQALFGRILKEKASRDQTGFFWVSHDVNLASEWADRVYFFGPDGIFGGGSIREEFNIENFRKLYPNSEIRILDSGHSSEQRPKLFLR